MSDPAPITTNGTVKIDPANPGQQHLFRISPTLDENRVLDLKPVYISLGLDPSAFPKELGGIADPAQSPHAAPKGVFDTALRGTGKYAGRIWYFKGDSYLRYYEKADGHDMVEGPLPIAANWPGWPPSFATGIDAALQGTAAYEGKVWFFKGSQYLRYDMAGDRVEFQPRPIAGNWRGVPDAFAQQIDAAIHGLGNYYGVCWLFQGNQYLRYNLTTDAAEGEPRPIAGNWGGQTWPASFAGGIDFAFYGTGANAEKIYFFRGNQYILYNLKNDQVEEGPTPIVKNWRSLAQFMPQPQLFIAEQYALRTFHGEMGRGDIVEGQRIQVPPGGLYEFYIITKKSETITQSSSTNILESQSQQAVDSFSQALRSDQSQSGSQEQYDYHMDASFHGDAELSLTGGEANADLHVKGGSQDVRNAFANAVNKQLENQATQTHETHKQQVSTESSGYQVNQQTETGFKQTIDNRGNAKVLNCVMFQLTQEYIVILSLVDAQLVFHNGDPRRAMTVPLHDMANLLDQCIVKPEDRARITASVVDTFTNVVDIAGQLRSLLAPTPNNPARYQVDRTLTSTYEVKDSAGNPLRSIVVPGIILSVDRPIVLTPNTAMALLETG